ncbi:MAG TPA: Lpg1974 family pore-forming outer membrane protein, partial [Pirellulales bacterium]|nr:Lpg1974 family pore-forming outer membrane protein [Pirellulales bacterium]
TFGVFTLSPGAQLTARSSLKLSYFDLEAMKRVNTLNWQWTGSAGVRYAYLSQSYDSAVSPPGAAANGGSFLSQRHFFNGAGPTVSFMGRRPIGDSPIGIFGSGRASMLFGNDQQSISEAYLSGLSTSYYRASWGVLPQAELEFGADFRRPIGQKTLIIENALTGQSWFGAGTSSGSTALGGNVSQATLGFYGWRASVGMTY